MTTPQHWSCPHCPRTYDSPLPLRRPPCHWCHPAGGRRRIRDFTLDEPSPPKPKAADGGSYETRLIETVGVAEKFPDVFDLLEAALTNMVEEVPWT